MYFVLILLTNIFVHGYNPDSDRIIVDFFYHKKIRTFIGFTCHDVSGDMLLIRNLSEKNIAANTYKLTFESEIHFLAKAPYWKLGILIDTRCFNIDDITSVFNQASEYRMFDELRSWLIMGNSLTDVLSVVNDSSFGISTDFVIAIFTEPESYIFYDVYNICKDRGSVLNVTFYGYWHSKFGLNINLTQSKFRRRSNLHRLVVRAMFYKSLFKAADLPLEEYYEDYQHKTRDSQSKFSYHVLSHLSDIYNFRYYSLHTQESPLWEKGDKVGPIERGMVHGEIDITGTPITFSPRRLGTVKFLHQDWRFRSCFFFRNPEATDFEVGEIFRPLTNEVWCFIGFSMTISLAVLLIIMHQDRTESRIMNFSNSLLIVLGALCQQSTDTKMDRISIRIAFLFIMIFSFLIFTYYSASVVSARLDDSTTKINDSLMQLGKLNLKMATEDMVYFDFFMKKPDWDTNMFYDNYWKKIPESKQYLLPDVGMKLVQKGGFAYHTHVEIAYLYMDRFFAHKEICEITEVHLGGPLKTAFAIHFNSTYVDIARVGLIRIVEAGLQMRQIHRWQYSKPLCRKEVLSATSVTIYEFTPHIILLIIGAMFAITGLALELFISKSGHHYILLKFRAATEKLHWGHLLIND